MTFTFTFTIPDWALTGLAGVVVVGGVLTYVDSFRCWRRARLERGRGDEPSPGAPRA